LTEAVKSIQSNGNSLIGRPLIHDALSMRFKQFAMTADPNCNACGLGVDRSLLPLCSDEQLRTVLSPRLRPSSPIR